MSRFRVSVVVPTRDRSTYLKNFLDSIKNAGDHLDELIVVDSSEKPNSQKINLKNVSLFGGKYVFFEPKGTSRALNAGLKHAKGDIIIVSNDDFVVTRGWIDNFLAHFTKENVMAVTGRMLSPGNDLPDKIFEETMSFDRGSKSRSFSKKDLNLARLLSTIQRIGAKRLHDKTPVPWAVGYGYASFRREIFNKIGCFDENLGRGTPRVGGEDPDIFYRILKAGYSIVYEPSAIVYHERAERRTIEGNFKDAFNSGISIRALTSKYYRKDPYMLLCSFGVFFWLVFSMLRTSLFKHRTSILKKMIAYELKGFLGIG